jgi:hypothetical protein
MDYHLVEDFCSSSQDSAQSDSESQDEAGYETEAADVTDASDTNLNVDWNTATDEDVADFARLLADHVHPPEYYIRQWEEFDEFEYAKEDYSPGTAAAYHVVPAAYQHQLGNQAEIWRAK